MSQEEFNLLRSRFPKPHERYSNYIKNLDSSLFPLDKSEFNDLKKLFSIPYETYAEHYNRLKSYFKEPLSPENFRIEKSLRVLVGESFIDHVVRIIDIFNGENGNTNCTQDVIIQLVNHQGMETLEVNNFIDHMLTYPFNYDSFEKFCSRQENKFKAETDPLVKTLSWYNRMKTLLPKLSDNTIEDYQKRVKEDKLEFPDITLKQFYRHKYGLPHPGELFSTFELRTKPKDSNNSNIEFSIPPSVIPLLIDISPSTPPIPPTYPPSLIPSISSSSHLTSSKPKPVLNRSTQINKITTIKPIQDICSEISKRCTKINKFNLCPEIHEFFDLKKFKKEVYETFISISPNFYIDHDNYSSMDQERRGDLLQEADFLAFKKGLPKLDETFYSFNKRIEPMGVIPNYMNNFEKLKIFYPRIHQITYDNYILDIEIKYDNTTTDYRDIINKLKLSRDEFTEYKLSFPRQFDFSYSAYKKRMEKEKINKILSEEDYNVTRQMNYPLVNETYKQHSQKLSLYGVDPIPQDIFKFLKGIYPTLLEKTYEHRVKYYVCEFLKLPNYAKDKYNIANEMIAEIIDKSNPDQEIQDKVNTLLPQRMSNEEMSLFIDRFPIVFQSHTDYLENYSNDLVNLPLDERLFHSLKTAYFISIDEIYEEYKARMESLELRALALNIFRYCKKFYPDLIKNYDDYKSSIKEYENFEIKNPYNYKFNKLLHLEIITISEEDYQTFQKNFPRAFDTSVDRQHVKNNASIFNHDNSDSIKTCYFPRLNEYYDTYITRIVNLGLNVLDYKSFVFFKAIYPNPVTALDYKKYKDNIESIDQNTSGPNVDRRHIMTETEFEHLTRNFPKLFQSWEKFSYNRRKTKTNSMINDTSDFFKNLFNDLKMVYYPKFGQTVDAYTIYILTMDIWCDSINWRDYFVNAILLYPTFFDEYNNYELNTYELPSGIHNYKLDYLKLNEEQFNIFYRLFPLPYESYTQYKIRKADLDLKQFCLTEEEFSYWQQVFPQISETYTNYKTRLESELYVQSIVSNVLFKLFKELFPQIDECYNSYQTRFDNALKNSNEDTKKQLSFLVTHMDFKAMHIISDTKSGGMAYKDFKVFKNSLPMPEELRDDYINRINYLAEVYNEDLPEILPLGLFNNLVEIYPKHNVSDYTTYCENMKEIDVIPVSKYTFDQLVTVAKKMIEQRYDVTPTAFYNVVSKDHENFPNH
ncbi:unnamed protein product [Aphis gossypii]|uniref:Uncharacterized protein n=1 Tax=Aphis gossypii TaxID=80765 RepID=A0A9P0NDB8_APHGO|nr:unnamed protein product [Aphis gossypii]